MARPHPGCGGVSVLVGPDAPDRMAMLWSRAGRHLGPALAASTASVVVDAGRLRFGDATSEPLASASLTLMLVRPVPEDLVGLAHRLPALQRAVDVAILLVGPGAYSPDNVSSELGVDVLGVLPDDRRSTALLAAGGGSRGLARTPLARAVRSVADAVAARVGTGDPAAAGSRPTEKLAEEGIS